MSATRSFENGLGRTENSRTGIGQTFELSLGGSPTPGLVVGGGFFATHVYVTKAESTLSASMPGVVDQSNVSSDSGSSTLAQFCPFVDYYFNPRIGLNVVAGPCFALADLNHKLRTGLGLNVGLGGEWFVSDGWSLGVLGRLQYASVSEGDSEPYSVLVPGVLFAATFN
jgi:hypothetical protein